MTTFKRRIGEQNSRLGVAAVAAAGAAKKYDEAMTLMKEAAAEHKDGTDVMQLAYTHNVGHPVIPDVWNVGLLSEEREKNMWGDHQVNGDWVPSYYLHPKKEAAK
jgi:hypothetical protein